MTQIKISIDCAMCGSSFTVTTLEDDIIQYGADNPIPLKVKVPVINCQDCGFSFTDYRAEEIRDSKVAWWLSHRCTICKANYVDSENGIDTCDSCLGRM